MSDDFSDLESRLTDTARASLERAGLIAHTYGSAQIGTEHLLLGVLAQNSSMGAKMLADNGITLDRTEFILGVSPKTVVTTTVYKGISQEVLQTIRTAWELVLEFDQEYIGTEHLVYSMLTQANSRVTQLLEEMNVDINSLKSDLERVFEIQQQESVSKRTQRRATKELGLLDKYSVDLTERAREDRLDPVVGRDKEIDRMITILGRRSKNNPALIGEPGVGKTAVVEGLAQRINSGKVPDFLRDKRILQLDLVSMIAGTKYRGQFEERIHKVMNTLTKHPEIIAFVDELHLLVGTGGAEGSMDAANILKPALARGEIRMVGATTFDEYRKYIEKDSALSRRFQTVIIDEPSADEAVAMMRGLSGKLEKYHNVCLSDEIIKLSVNLSQRYINERFLPDKAIDVIDEASALLRSEKVSKSSRKHRYHQQIKRVSERIDQAVESQNYELAASLKTRMLKLEDQMTSIEDGRVEPTDLTERYIRRAVAAMTGVPLANIESDSLKSLAKLEERLKKQIIGQDEAVHQVSRVIKRARSGLTSSTRPLGSFVLLGPTGVGKTEMARVLAKEVFGGENSLIKIDMSELSEKHTAARLIGAPAGYVGYDEGGKLTDTVRRKPYSVVLFDEIEKAHPDVLNLLLQLLEDGKLTDAKGRVVSFRNTIIILTSNVGAAQMIKDGDLGFGSSTKKTKSKILDENSRTSMRELEKIMRPELINRFDAILTFNPLSRKAVGKIFDLLADEVRNLVAEKGVVLKVNASAKRLLIKQGYDEQYGVRPLRRIIESQLSGAVADAFIRGEGQAGDTFEAVSNKGEVAIDVKKA